MKPKSTSSILIAILSISALSVLAPSAFASTCSPAGTTGLTAKIVASSGQTITGVVDATGCDVGIYVGPGTTGVVVTGATVSGANDHGIFVQDASHITIKDSTVTGNQVATHPDCPIGAPPVLGCIAEDKAVMLVGTSNSLIQGNDVSFNLGTPGGGIGIADDGPWDPGAPFPHSGSLLPSSHNTVIGNNVTHNLSDCQIVVAAYNPGAGVTHNIVAYNSISVGVTGVVVAADSPNTEATYNQVIGNTITDEFIPGIIIHSNTPGDVVSHNIVKWNILSNNGPDGEVQTGTGDSSPGPTGILLAGQVEPVTFSVVNENTISNEHYGVWACNTAKTPINGNSFSGTVDIPIVTVATCPPPALP